MNMAKVMKVVSKLFKLGRHQINRLDSQTLISSVKIQILGLDFIFWFKGEPACSKPAL